MWYFYWSNRIGGGCINKCYTLNEDYFEFIDSDEKAYWLGFIFADGCISKDHKQLIIELSKKDKNLLDRFLIAINRNNKPKETGKSFRVVVPNKRFVNHLLNKELTPAKSLTLVYPKNDIIPKEFICDFIRGYFDGDGCIFTTKTLKSGTDNTYCTSCEFYLLGTIEFLHTIESFLPVDDMKFVKMTEKTNVYKLRVANRTSILKIYKFLYNNATIYLERKHNIFLKIKENEEKYLLEHKRNITNKNTLCSSDT